jgi:histidinol-phosphate aminotransferase
VTAAELGTALNQLAELGLLRAQIAAFASIETKVAEPGLVEFARSTGIALHTHSAHRLAAEVVPNGSGRVAAVTGTPSVAEAAALATARELGELEPELVDGKRKSRRVTLAVARIRGYDLRHHGDAELVSGEPVSDMVDLAVNVRPGPLPGWLARPLTASLTGLASYPRPELARSAVAARHGRDPAEVLLTAGAAEAFVLLARTLRPRRTVVVHPQFTEPEAALLAAGHRVERVILAEGEGYVLDPARIPPEADLVVLGNPTNPTSVLHPAEVIAGFIRPGRTVVVDEAFADTVPGERESLAGRADLPGLVVVRSLTKTWGLAGLRVGYLLAEPEMVRRLADSQPLWAVSTPALAAALACSSDEALAEQERIAAEWGRHRRHLLAALAGVPGVAVAGSPESSFVLMRAASGTGSALREILRRKGYVLRRGDTFPGLTADHLRIAVRPPAVLNGFVTALTAAVAELPVSPGVAAPALAALAATAAELPVSPGGFARDPGTSG